MFVFGCVCMWCGVYFVSDYPRTYKGLVLLSRATVLFPRELSKDRRLQKLAVKSARQFKRKCNTNMQPLYIT